MLHCAILYSLIELYECKIPDALTATIYSGAYGQQQQQQQQQQGYGAFGGAAAGRGAGMKGANAYGGANAYTAGAAGRGAGANFGAFGGAAPVDPEEQRRQQAEKAAAAQKVLISGEYDILPVSRIKVCALFSLTRGIFFFVATICALSFSSVKSFHAIGQAQRELQEQQRVERRLAESVNGCVLATSNAERAFQRVRDSQSVSVLPPPTLRTNFFFEWVYGSRARHLGANLTFNSDC